jgi:hypothetical protein
VSEIVQHKLIYLHDLSSLMRGNQLPVSANRWQHGSSVMFCNFNLVKNHTIPKNSTTARSREMDAKIRNTYNFLMHV